jgi:hypothetical protein
MIRVEWAFCPGCGHPVIEYTDGTREDVEIVAGVQIETGIEHECEEER